MYKTTKKDETVKRWTTNWNEKENKLCERQEIDFIFNHNNTNYNYNQQ